MSSSSDYQHSWQGGAAVGLPVGKVVCVGRNYADHAKELNNPGADRTRFYLSNQRPVSRVLTRVSSYRLWWGLPF